jgi:hypothetical protein
MSITGPMVLPPDLLIIPASEVAEAIRQRSGCGDSDFVVTRPRSRTQSRVVNADTAALLELFRQPKTIVEAVLTLCATRGTDPERTLEHAFATLTPFMQARWLVPADSEEAQQIAPTLDPGEVVDGYTIVDCRQLLEDTEVYQVHTADHVVAALKLIRLGAPRSLDALFAQEARVLTHLGGGPAPRLLSAGDLNGQRYLAMTWCSGVPVTQAAMELRQIHRAGGRGRVLGLCRAIAGAYATLHERGVIHGDVSPRNILVDAMAQVSVVDYGYAHLVHDGDVAAVPRGGVAEFHEPEFAAAALEGRPLPLPSMAGEQYALAALMYWLVTGDAYLRFSAVKQEVLGQIANDRPLTFAERGVAVWASLEAVLGKALDKNPEQRFSSIRELLSALDAVDAPEPELVTRSTRRSEARDAAGELIARLSAGDIAVFELPAGIPHCSITYGAAGIGYALYAVACMRDDAALLAAADAWAVRAVREADAPGGFVTEQLDLDEHRVRPSSVYYGRAGVHLVQALVARAMGDEATLTGALRGYLAACQAPCEWRDLTLGRAGVLAGCALLLDAMGSAAVHPPADHPVRQIIDLGQSTMAALWAEADRAPFGEMTSLGIAHGWAGLCYAALLWSEVRGDAPPAPVRTMLERLMALAQHHGRGVRWPTEVRGDQGHHAGYLESWCHGTPGYVSLWTAAYRACGDPRYLRIAEQAAWTAWEAPASLGTLCCGDAGRAYALLNLFRHTGDREWRLRASALAERAVEVCASEPRPLTYSLFKGTLGAAVLMEDLDQPERARFPMFERR